MGSNADEFLPTRESLLLRLRDCDDQQGWTEFFDTYWKLIYGVARRAGLSDAEAQDVVQETIIAVARTMPSFVYNAATGSFKAWLLLVTKRRIADQFRKKHYRVGDKRLPRESPFETALVDSIPAVESVDLEGIWNQEWQKRLVEAAVEKVKAQAKPKEFQIFHLHVTRQIPAGEVARRLGVKLPEVYYAKYKISAQLRKQIRLLEEQGI